MISEKTTIIFIRSAAILAFIAGLITLLIIFTGKFGFNMYNLLDVFLFWGLSFGILKKSRTCAIIVLVYHLLNRIDMFRRTQSLSISFGLVSIIAIVIYFLGILGTFAYHKKLKLQNK